MLNFDPATMARVYRSLIPTMLGKVLEVPLWTVTRVFQNVPEYIINFQPEIWRLNMPGF